MKLLARIKSEFAGQSGKVKRNSYMENLVELPDGRRTYMTAKEIEELKNQKA